MSQLHIEVSKVINVNPAEIYAVLSDYRAGHPAILPKPYFSKLVVEQGGQGAGTIIEAYMDVYGKKQVFRQVVSEPEPGRVLVEADEKAGVTTTFKVDRVGDGDQSQVTISTTSRTSLGLRGFMERLFQPMIVRRIFEKELQLLADYVQRAL